MNTQLDKQEWLTAERAYVAQRTLDGNIPHQFWNADLTIERRAYRIYLARAAHEDPA